ncbi:purple acid phosphatase family protein [Algoriphagus namhaensis]
MTQRFLLFLALYLVSLSSFAQETENTPQRKFLESWSKPTVQPDRIILNVTEDLTTMAHITWRTSEEVDQGFVEIAAATADPMFIKKAAQYPAKTTLVDFTDIRVAGTRAKYHSAKLKGLKPGTTYGYRVGDGKLWSEWFQFTTATSDPDEAFSFLYVGDAQNYILELWSRVVREGFRKAPDAKFFIHAGDLVNHAHREQEWHEWFAAGGFIHSMIPSMPNPGNHEYKPRVDGENEESILSVQWTHQFTLPDNGPKGLEETVYFIDYKDTKIITLNSNVHHKPQAKWLEDVLANNKKKWVIITYHHPMFSAASGRDNDRLRKIWKPIFDQYGVDLVLQGHDHSYARGRTAPGSNELDGVNMRDQAGTVYVVSVSGGKMYEVGGEWNELGAIKDRSAEKTQLFQVITIEGDRLIYKSFTPVNELYDSFELLKTSKGPNKFIEKKSEAIPERVFSDEKK